MSKIEQKKLHKEKALLDTAFELFTSQGAAKTSVSDIVTKAGMAKGTFYLYFKDKYDLQDKLVTAKAGQVFMKAYHALEKEPVSEFEDQLIFIVDHVLEQLRNNKILLRFISKNLSWGVFLGNLERNAGKADSEFLEVYRHIMERSKKNYHDPELLLYMIIELINSTCYSVILHETPVTLEELKSPLYQTIRDMLQRAEIT